jgi:glycosyltransferase involved in cell wall biosynthesis
MTFQSLAGLKIAMIEPHAMLGVWKYDLGLAKELSKLSSQVTLITSKSFPDIDQTLFNGCIFRDFPNLRAHTTSAAKGLSYLAGVSKALWRLRTGDFDIIHWQLFNIFPPAETVMAKLLWGLRERLVMTIHDVDPWSAVKGKSHFWLRSTYRTAPRLIVHHEVNRKELAAHYQLRSERIHVVPHGSFTHFTTGSLDQKLSRKMLGLPENARIVLFFGEIRHEKGLIYLIRATQAIRARIPDLCLVIAGRPRHIEMSECLTEIETAGLKDVVITRLQHIEDNLVEAYFSSADLVVLPYLAITQSGVLFEAMTAGRPVVATDVGALGPTVQESQAGYVVPPGQVQPLAEAIVAVLQQPDVAQQMAQNGRRAALDMYSWARCAQKTMAVYRELLPHSSLSLGPSSTC